MQRNKKGWRALP